VVTPNPSNPIPALKVPPDIPSSKNLAHDHCHAHKEKEEHGHDLGHTHKEDNEKKDTKKEGTKKGDSKKEDTKKEDTKQEDHGQDSKTPPNFFSFIYSEKFKTGIVNVIVVTIISSIVQISISRYSADSNVTIARDNVDANIRLQADTLKLKVENAAKAFAASELKLDIGKAEKHIERKEIEEAIQNMAIQPISEMKFAVLCGRILVGKTESIVSALKGRRGVVIVTLDSEGVVTIGTIKEKICEQVGLGKSADHFEALNECGLQEVGQNPHSSY